MTDLSLVSDKDSEWRIECMRAKFRMWVNAGIVLSDEALSEGLATNAEEISAAKDMGVAA
jgi:hypothetical protein